MDLGLPDVVRQACPANGCRHHSHTHELHDIRQHLHGNIQIASRTLMTPKLTAAIGLAILILVMFTFCSRSAGLPTSRAGSRRRVQSISPSRYADAGAGQRITCHKSTPCSQHVSCESGSRTSMALCIWNQRPRGWQILELVRHQDGGRRQGAPCDGHQPSMDGVEPNGVQGWALVGRHGS